jgi:GNAT superfamily N-acetyltransferase
MIRLIEEGDYFKGYMDLINVFTREPRQLSYEVFCDTLKQIQSQNSEIYVIEKETQIVSSIHLLFEYKLHNNCKLVCHIEDLVTAATSRGQGYASRLLEFAVKRASEKNCYKVVLTSNPENGEFYKKNSFVEKGNEYCKYL